MPILKNKPIIQNFQDFKCFYDMGASCETVDTNPPPPEETPAPVETPSPTDPVTEAPTVESYNCSSIRSGVCRGGNETQNMIYNAKIYI